MSVRGALARVGAAAAALAGVAAGIAPSRDGATAARPAGGPPPARRRARRGSGAGEAGRAEPAGPPEIDARAWILIDPRDDEVLASKRQRPRARRSRARPS